MTSRNKRITKEAIEEIINKCGNIGDENTPLTVKNLSLYQHVFVPKDYLSHPDPTVGFIARESWDELEFLGDSVLGYVCAFEVFDSYRGHGEGDLTKLKSGITRGDHIARYGLELGLHEYMLCSNVMEFHAQTNIKYSRYYRDNLEDMFEALLGAMVLDNGGVLDGLRFARRFIKALMTKYVRLDALYNLDLDPKGTLINFCNSLDINTPTYPKIRLRGHTDTLYGVALKLEDIKGKKLLNSEEILRLSTQMKKELTNYKLEFPKDVIPEKYLLVGWSTPFENNTEQNFNLCSTKKKNDLIQVANRRALQVLHEKNV